MSWCQECTSVDREETGSQVILPGSPLREASKKMLRRLSFCHLASTGGSFPAISSRNFPMRSLMGRCMRIG